MKKTYFPGVLEIVKKFFEKKNSSMIFPLLPVEFIELFNAHYNLLESINGFKTGLTDKYLMEELEVIRTTLEVNVEKVTEIISKIIGRKLKIHTVEKSDTLWKIFKKYNSNIDEIVELNNIKNVLSLKENKVLLVPLKY